VSRVEFVTRETFASSRRALTAEADDRQESIIEAVLREGYRFDWKRIARNIGDTTAPLEALGKALDDELSTPAFLDTLAGLRMNGELLATWIQRRHDALARLRPPLPLHLAEPTFTPSRAVDYWQRLLNLTDRQAAELMENSDRLRAEAIGLRGRVKRAVLDRLESLYEEAISEGMSSRDFIRRIREMPTPKGWSGGLDQVMNAILETEYRTRLTEVYGGARHEQILERKAAFPFTQFMAIRDSRTTWWICLPMGTAGPGGTGYIAASDDPIWIKWRVPCHYRCRSDHSPISYLEAQRLGILAKDGRTKIARVGSNPMRPFGDPPRFATDPVSGAVRDVEPQKGFGGGGEGIAVSDVVQEAPPPTPQPPRTDPVPPTRRTRAPENEAPQPERDRREPERDPNRVPPSPAYERAKELGFNVPPLPTLTVARAIFASIDKLGDGFGTLVPLDAVRDDLSDILPGSAFDRAVMALLYNGNVQMQSHPTPSLIPPEQLAKMIRHPPPMLKIPGTEIMQQWYTAIGIRVRV
jgi:hypothetical protein